MMPFLWIQIDGQGGGNGRRLRWRESAEVVGCAATKGVKVLSVEEVSSW